MSARILDGLVRSLGELRHEITRKRVRALAHDQIVVDSTRALLVYEPERTVPAYAVPDADVLGELVPAPDCDGGHTCDGEPLSIATAGHVLAGAAFRPADPDLDGYVILAFDAFDGGWFDEEEPVFGHPRDPYHALELLQSSREVRVERDGVLLAASTRALLVFEGPAAPPRAFLPREDVRVALRPHARRSTCPYKGRAGYWALAGEADPIACSFETPLRGAAELAGLVAFLDEQVDVVLGA